jgi:DNA repair ATPase RecN
MKKKNPARFVRLILAALVFSSAAACQRTPRAPAINREARAEAESTAKEAAQLYKKTKDLLDYKFSSFPTSDALASIKKGKPLFEDEAADFQTAEEKFRQASAKYVEALNGGQESDSELHRRLFRLSEAYKKWAELAELDRQISQEAAEIKDLKSFTDRAKKLDEKARELNDEVHQEILAS